MKKLVSILLIFIVVISLLVGCNKENKPTTPIKGNPTTGTVETKPTEPPMPVNPTLPSIDVEIEYPSPDISVDEFLENFEVVDSLSKIPEDLFTEQDAVITERFEDAISKLHGRLFVVQGITHAYYTSFGDDACRVVMNKGGWLFMKERAILNDEGEIYFYLFDSSLNFNEIVLQIHKGQYPTIEDDYENVNGWDISPEKNGSYVQMTYKINDEYFMSVALTRFVSSNSKEMIDDEAFKNLYTKFANSFYVEKVNEDLAYECIEIDSNNIRTFIVDNLQFNPSNKVCLHNWTTGTEEQHYANIITLFSPQYNKTYTITEYPADKDFKWFEADAKQNGYTLEKFDYAGVTVYKLIYNNTEVHGIVIEGAKAIYTITTSGIKNIQWECDFIFKEIIEIV